MSWNIQIQDPSGEKRKFGLKGTHQIGREISQADIVLRDHRVAPLAATLCRFGKDGYWFKVNEPSVHACLGDLLVREACLPPGVPLRLGDTILTLQPSDSSDTSIVDFPLGLTPWLTCSSAGKSVLELSKKVASTPLSVYLGGETGTGKEVLAHLIHAWSDRSKNKFVPVNCGALPAGLAESELFGHVRGAFTGAQTSRTGAFLQAHRGTLFLDEIGDLPLDMQVKILRFLESGEIRPVGSDQIQKVNVRVICATHKPLLQLVEAGLFRRDLYYRLASVAVEIPPLRDRPEDIELLATRFASESSRTLSKKAIQRLQAYVWMGNVRELRHAIERAIGMVGRFQTHIGEESFEFLFDPQSLAVTGSTEKDQIERGLLNGVLKLEEMERLMVLKALRLAQGNRTQAAQVLGVARSTLFEMMRRHRVQGPRMVF